MITSSARSGITSSQKGGVKCEMPLASVQRICSCMQLVTRTDDELEPSPRVTSTLQSRMLLRIEGLASTTALRMNEAWRAPVSNMQDAVAIVISLIISSAVVSMCTASDESCADWRLFS